MKKKKSADSVGRPVTSQPPDSTTSKETTDERQTTANEAMRATLRQMLNDWASLSNVERARALQASRDAMRAWLDVDDDVVCVDCGHLVARSRATRDEQRSVATIVDYHCPDCVNALRIVDAIALDETLSPAQMRALDVLTVDDARGRKLALVDSIAQLHAALGHPYGDRDDFSAWLDQDIDEHVETQLRTMLDELQQLAKIGGAR